VYQCYYYHIITFDCCVTGQFIPIYSILSRVPKQLTFGDFLSRFHTSDAFPVKQSTASSKQRSYCTLCTVFYNFKTWANGKYLSLLQSYTLVNIINTQHHRYSLTIQDNNSRKQLPFSNTIYRRQGTTHNATITLPQFAGNTFSLIAVHGHVRFYRNPQDCITALTGYRLYIK